MLNLEQQSAYKCIISYLKENKLGLFFVDGTEGTGKKFLYCALYTKACLLDKNVVPTTTSGKAASNMPTCRTAYSRFNTPTNCGQSLLCNLCKHTSLDTIIKEALIIWDEATKARRENTKSLDLILRDLCLSDVPFGGKGCCFRW